MKSILIAGFAALGMLSSVAAVAAADLSAPAVRPVLSQQPVKDWTGFYAGIFGGLAASQHTLTAIPVGGGPAVTDIGFTGNGALGGLQVGYDYDLGQFVVGGYTDIAASNVRAEISGTGFGGAATAFKMQLNYLGTVQARAGVKLDSLLGYVHGGLAYGSTDQDLSALGVPAGIAGTQTRTGYVLGAGVEYAVTDNLSLQTEYSFVNLGDALIASGVAGSYHGALSFHMVKAGLNYRF
ncbi:MAG: porin family protein [Massilia sp.]|nr:porin family protein [Massilia sp.]